jgi:glycosyltransferase involved in cell wall biosynthesis
MTKTYLIGTGYLSSNIAKQIKNSNSYGIPLISAAKGDIRKIIKNNYNGYIFNKRMPQIFSYYINETIKNYKYLSKNSINHARKFNINKSCQTVWRFLKIENNNIR